MQNSTCSAEHLKTSGISAEADAPSIHPTKRTRLANLRDWRLPFVPPVRRIRATRAIGGAPAPDASGTVATMLVPSSHGIGASATVGRTAAEFARLASATVLVTARFRIQTSRTERRAPAEAAARRGSARCQKGSKTEKHSDHRIFCFHAAPFSTSSPETQRKKQTWAPG